MSHFVVKILTGFARCQFICLDRLLFIWHFVPMKYTVFFFPNGQTAVCKDGEQVPALQESWFRQFVDFLISKGIDIEECEFNLPNYQKAKIKKYGEDWNYIIS